MYIFQIYDGKIEYFEEKISENRLNNRKFEIPTALVQKYST